MLSGSDTRPATIQGNALRFRYKARHDPRQCSQVPKQSSHVRCKTLLFPYSPFTIRHGIRKIFHHHSDFVLQSAFIIHFLMSAFRVFRHSSSSAHPGKHHFSWIFLYFFDFSFFFGFSAVEKTEKACIFLYRLFFHTDRTPEPPAPFPARPAEQRNCNHE